MKHPMKTTLRVCMMVSLIALAACSKNKASGGFGADGSDSMSALQSTSMSGANNPNSPEYFQQTIGDRVLFSVDQSSLNSEGQMVLDGQAEWLASNPDYNVVIEGHADEQGTREYNLALGARRANSVREYLTSIGIDGTRIQTVSYGKERPIEICSAESCYTQNRRAVTVLQNLGF